MCEISAKPCEVYLVKPCEVSLSEVGYNSFF